MPKRSSEAAVESPRKLVRTSSASSKTPVVGVKKDDAALTAISDDEDNIGDDAGPAKPVLKKMPPSIDLYAIQKRFFEQFDRDGQNVTTEAVDVEAYKKLLGVFPDDEESEKKALVDHFTREYLTMHILKDISKWNSFMELSVQLSRAEVSSPSLPVTLMSDLFELSGLADCEVFFEYVENNLKVWKEPFFLNSGRNAILRMCNDLLRRLSRAQNTRFCGKILIFLASYFPFSERSGLNIMSEFNMENVTVYKSGDGSDDPEDNMDRNIEGNPDENTNLFEGIQINVPGLDQILSSNNEVDKGSKVKVDYNLYVKFWSLQDFFRNPMNCYNKVAWKTFSSYTQDVLGAFASFKMEEPRSKTKAEGPKTKGSIAASTSGQKQSSVHVIPKLGDEDLFFPKYLTNRRLLELQLGDPDFRRYFLVQLLIILQYLTAAVKFKSESQVLSEEQLEFVKKTTEKIYTLLSEMKPGGSQMAKAVKHILKREDLWSKWKNDGCQPFKKPVVVATSVTAEPGKDKDGNLINEAGSDERENENTVKTLKKRYLGDIIEEADANNKFLLGNSELTRLWNICGDNLEACRSKARDFAPSIEEFFTDAMKELDAEPCPPAPVTADPSKRDIKPKKLLGNSNFGWRSLRLLARKSPYFFQMISGSPIHPLQNYLEFILKKIAADLEIPVVTEETAQKSSGDTNGKKSGKIPANTLASAPSSDNISVTQQVVESDQMVEGGADENDELLKGVKEENVMEDNEEGEVDKNVRNLTEDEHKALGKALGAEWKKLALKLGFTNDEAEYFESEKKANAAEYMLKMWTEQEKDDATVADLLYQLEGLKLSNLVKSVFP